jgi:hypothetical protein
LVFAWRLQHGSAAEQGENFLFEQEQFQHAVHHRPQQRLLRGIIGGFPIKFVAVAVKKSEHFFIVRPEIKEIRDLNGKKLGVATLFGSDQRAAEEMIRGKGSRRI